MGGRDPTEILKAIEKTSGFNPGGSRAPSELSAKQLVRMFDTNVGGDLKGRLDRARGLAHEPCADPLRPNLDAALLKIAGRHKGPPSARPFRTKTGTPWLTIGDYPCSIGSPPCSQRM